MIRVEIKPRQDNLFDIYVSDEGDHFLNSNQGYENVEDAIAIARRLFGTRSVANAAGDGVATEAETVALRVTYRNGKTMTEQLR